MIKLGVIGQGFVGSAVTAGFRGVGFDVETYDKFIIERSSATLPDLVQRSDVIFVCVPTPADEQRDGACDTSIVESVVLDIVTLVTVSHRDPNSQRKVVVIKSTVPPGTTERLQVMAGKIVDVVFNPEFLNARSALHDFVTQDHVIIGGDEIPSRRVKELYERLVPNANMRCTSARIAETVKYVKNCFFATKVSFFNEMYQMCEQLDVSYDDMIALARLDDRVGFEHTRVPGPSPGAGPCEGRMMMGYGGACLVKDIRAFKALAHSLGIDSKVMDAAWEKNLEVRPERDWEYIPGCMTRRDQ